jgi:hypothetical protein
LREQREITHEEGKAVADANGWLFFETSAKANINVTETFVAAARVGLLTKQNAMVRCRKVDFSGQRSEVIWAGVQGDNVAYVKDTVHDLSSKDAITIAIPGCKCMTLDLYKGSHHILVISPASDANKVPVHHALPQMLRLSCESLCRKMRNMTGIFPSMTQDHATISWQVNRILCQSALHILHLNF